MCGPSIVTRQAEGIYQRTTRPGERSGCAPPVDSPLPRSSTFIAARYPNNRYRNALVRLDLSKLFRRPVAKDLAAVGYGSA